MYMNIQHTKHIGESKNWEGSWRVGGKKCWMFCMLCVVQCLAMLMLERFFVPNLTYYKHKYSFFLSTLKASKTCTLFRLGGFYFGIVFAIRFYLVFAIPFIQPKQSQTEVCGDQKKAHIHTECQCVFFFCRCRCRCRSFILHSIVIVLQQHNNKLMCIVCCVWCTGMAYIKSVLQSWIRASTSSEKQK